MNTQKNPQLPPLKITECGLNYEINYSNDNVRNVMLRHIGQLQARIDSLMLEYCPDEMTKEQVENWEIHQMVSPDNFHHD